MINISQGTIIYGMRSDKYPEIMTYAIIISARCDIANDKISKLYYLVAVDAKEWFCTNEGFGEAYSDTIKTRKNSFQQKIKKYELNADIILSLNEERALHIFDNYIDDNKEKASILKEYYKTINLVSLNSDFNKRKMVVKELWKPASQFLIDITKGSKFHYFFIPQDAYLNDGKKNGGLIVDLQEIEIMQINDARHIHTPGIDYKILSGKTDKEKRRLEEKYWLKKDDDFVGIEGVIKSPWCELLMQKFSNDFIRIGGDGAIKSDFEELVKAI